MNRNELADRLVSIAETEPLWRHNQEVLLEAAKALRDVGVTDDNINRGWHVLLERWSALGTLGVTKAAFRDALEAALSPKAVQGETADGWLPIASAPQNETVLGVVDGDVRLIRWCKTSHVPIYGWNLADQGAEEFEICHPALWQPLPPPPKAAPRIR